MSIKYESNLDNVKKALDKAQNEALTKIGMLVQAESQVNAPVDSGRLKQSITNQVNESDKSVEVGTNVEYAVWVHEGTSKQEAQPFIKDAVMNNINKIKDIAGQEISTNMKWGDNIEFKGISDYHKSN